MKTITLKIQDMHCVSCAMSIDGELEDTAGVASASTNYAQAETRLQYDEQKVSLESILEAVKRAGYNAVVKESVVGSK